MRACRTLWSSGGRDPWSLCSRSSRIPIEERRLMENDDAGSSEVERLSAMSVEAETYISSFSWAPPIVERTCCFGIGDIMAIFMFKFARPIDETTDRLWVIVGDLPSAYLVVDDADDARQATERYCDLMQNWCEAVEHEGNLSEVYPVRAPSTKENADLLRKRILFVRDELLPTIPLDCPSGGPI